MKLEILGEISRYKTRLHPAEPAEGLSGAKLNFSRPEIPLKFGFVMKNSMRSKSRHPQSHFPAQPDAKLSVIFECELLLLDKPERATRSKDRAERAVS